MKPQAQRLNCLPPPPARRQPHTPRSPPPSAQDPKAGGKPQAQRPNCLPRPPHAANRPPRNAPRRPRRTRRPEGSRRRNDHIAFLRPRTPPTAHHAKPPAVRAGPQDRRTLSSPPTPPKPPTPLSPLAIYISQTWHTYPHPHATIEVAPQTPAGPSQFTTNSAQSDCHKSAPKPTALKTLGPKVPRGEGGTRLQDPTAKTST